jgi:hypothetical protein
MPEKHEVRAPPKMVFPVDLSAWSILPTLSWLKESMY